MSEKFALVTGASTGIGHASAIALVKEGYHVFAGVRNEADGERLRREGAGKIEPVMLDVTNAAQIEHAVGHITGVVGPAGLDGLVNNAGGIRAEGGYRRAQHPSGQRRLGGRAGDRLFACSFATDSPGHGLNARR